MRPDGGDMNTVRDIWSHEHGVITVPMHMRAVTCVCIITAAALPVTLFSAPRPGNLVPPCCHTTPTTTTTTTTHVNEQSQKMARHRVSGISENGVDVLDKNGKIS